MGPLEVQGQLPGEFEKADRGQARRRRSRCRREAKKTGPGRGSDGSVKAKPRADGRQEEARCNREVRSSRGSRRQGTTRKRIRRAFSFRLSACAGLPALSIASKLKHSRCSTFPLIQLSPFPRHQRV